MARLSSECAHGHTRYWLFRFALVSMLAPRLLAVEAAEGHWREEGHDASMFEFLVYFVALYLCILVVEKLAAAVAGVDDSNATPAAAAEGDIEDASPLASAAADAVNGSGWTSIPAVAQHLSRMLCH